jgi:hypothetical protein
MIHRSMFRAGFVFIAALGASLTAQEPARPDTRELVPQPMAWVAFQATLERNGVAVGRFLRDGHGSTRLELEAPDERGRMVIIHNVPQATYYVYRPGSGWTAQPMVLPTTGYLPVPVRRMDAGAARSEAVEGYAVFEQSRGTGRERRAPALNFFAVVRESADGLTVERYRGIQVATPPASAFVPPAGAAIIELREPGGIVARPVAGGGQ